MTREQIIIAATRVIEIRHELTRMKGLETELAELLNKLDAHLGGNIGPALDEAAEEMASIRSAAAALGSLGGSATAKRGPEYFSRIAGMRKNRKGGRPRVRAT